MKRFIMLVVVAGAFALAPAAFANNGSDHSKLDHQAVNASNCAGTGTLVVDVTYILTNDPDSAVGTGTSWATDTIGRTLKVWDQGDGTYCVSVMDSGSFVTTGALDPMNTTAAPPPEGVVGEMQGGYTGTVTGVAFDPPSGLATSGSLGSYDYTAGGFSFTHYFPGFASTDFAYDGWGWVYTTAQNGVWVNQASGNSGDITG